MLIVVAADEQYLRGHCIGNPCRHSKRKDRKQRDNAPAPIESFHTVVISYGNNNAVFICLTVFPPEFTLMTMSRFEAPATPVVCWSGTVIKNRPLLPLPLCTSCARPSVVIFAFAG